MRLSERVSANSAVAIANNILYAVGLDGGLVPGDYNGNSQFLVWIAHSNAHLCR